MPRPRPQIEELAGYHAPAEGRLGALRLDFCEWTEDAPPPEVVQALQNLTPEALVAYPEYGEFTRKLARFIGVPKECAWAFNGSDEALQLLISCYLGPGDVAVLPSPTFSMFFLFLKMAGATAFEVPLRDDAALSFDLDGLRAAVVAHRAKALIIANPNNPTGSWTDPEAIFALAKDFPDTLVIVDEAYAEFAPSRIRHRAHELPNMVVTGTFSKAFGLAGARLGWAAAAPEIIRVLAKVRLPYSLNSLAVQMGSVLIDLAPRLIPKRLGIVQRGRDRLAEDVAALGLEHRPTQSNAMLVRLGERAADLAERLRDRGILVRDLSRTPRLAGWVRVTIGMPEQIEEFLAALGELLRGSMARDRTNSP